MQQHDAHLFCLCHLQLSHNEPLLLADVPYRYEVEFNSKDEARFPELFKPQVRRAPVEITQFGLCNYLFVNHWLPRALCASSSLWSASVQWSLQWPMQWPGSAPV